MNKTLLNRLIRGMSTSNSFGKVQASIESKLGDKFNPYFLQVINESSSHNVPKNSETHFKVVLVSEEFDGLKVLDRHRMVNDVLKEELENGVHALSLKLKTIKQWEKNSHVEPSPNCRGGSGL